MGRDERTLMRSSLSLCAILNNFSMILLLFAIISHFLFFFLIRCEKLMYFLLYILTAYLVLDCPTLCSQPVAVISGIRGKSSMRDWAVQYVSKLRTSPTSLIEKSAKNKSHHGRRPSFKLSSLFQWSTLLLVVQVVHATKDDIAQG